MDDSFASVDVDAARELLRELPVGVRREGEAMARDGSVSQIIAEGDDLFVAKVSGRNGRVYEVELDYLVEEGWLTDCDCGSYRICAHSAAAIFALLAEHSKATVRNLSAGAIAPAPLKAPAKATASVERTDLAKKLMEAVGRPLNAEETRLVKRVRSTFQRARQMGYFSAWDLHEIGIALPPYQSMQLWPSMPDNEVDFWNYIAYALTENHMTIPAVLAPATDLEKVGEKIRMWRRQTEIERWKQKLAAASVTGAGVRGEVEKTDLRLMLHEEYATLQWRRPGQGEFHAVKLAQLRKLTESSEEDIRLGVEEALLWQFFAQRADQGMGSTIDYDDPQCVRFLRRVLKSRHLDAYIVNEAGAPIPRASMSLRWNIVEPESNEGDYSLSLVQADGSPTPPLICTVSGHPTLYVSRDAIFEGPPADEKLLDSNKRNQIPAAALENSEGVDFLRALGVEPPPRLKEKIVVLKPQVVIHCELVPIYPGSTTENCAVTVQAAVPDGRELRWDASEWQETTPEVYRRKPKAKGGIVVYDRALMDRIPPLLEPLQLKREGSYFAARLVTRVNKKFPEIFAAWLKTVPPEIELRLADDLATLGAEAVAGRVKLEVKESDIDWFDLRVVLDVSDTTLTQQELNLLLNAKGAFVRLKGKGWRRLQFNLDADEDEKLARLGLSARELSAEPQRLHALQLADDAAKKFMAEEQVEQVRRRAEELKARVAPDLPAGVTAQLRPYQLEGFHFLAYLSSNRFGGILADDMGLGKTLQTLSWLLWLRTQEVNGAPAAGPSLVICPKSVMENWSVEALRFTPGLRVRVWSVGTLPGFKEGIGEADVHVINYAQLRSLGETLANTRWLALILDEGQYIKNPNSQTAQVARSLKGQHRLILSGTPIENRLMDLWSLMSFAMPGVLSSRNQFGRIYDAKEDPLARRRLSARVRPFLLRRTKSQVAKDLPDRVEEDLLCEIEGEQKTLYRAELKRAQQLLLSIKTQQELAKQQFHFLTSLLRLRQICCDPRLLQPGSKAPSAKVEALMEQLEPLMEEGHKVLVFSQFVEMLNLLKPALESKEWPLFFLAGSTENRGELVQQFQATEGRAIFLISLKAGGFGLNLTAASYVVLFDPWWNPAVEAQAIDRTHRIGQTNKVIAYRLLIKDSIEEKIRELQKQKKALAEDVLGEERFAQSLTLDDLRFLLAG